MVKAFVASQAGRVSLGFVSGGVFALVFGVYGFLVAGVLGGAAFGVAKVLNAPL